jgi:hypothetical protein
MISLILAIMLSIGGSPAVGPGAAGIQGPIDNSCAINHFFEDYSQKTASRVDSKKTPGTPLINQPKTQIMLSFQLCLKEKLYLRGYMDSMNLYQGFNMNPFNFVDPFGKQHWIIEEELAQEEALREHLIKKYGEKQGEIEFSKIKERKRIIETTMVASFGVGLSTALIAPYLSVPALIATFGSISTYSALESYSNRKQEGQTEIEAKRGAFAAATGIGYLFNLMGFDYGTLEGVSQEQVENAWSTLIGGTAGGWFAKMLTAPTTVNTTKTFKDILTPSEQLEFEALREKYPEWMPSEGLNTPATVRTVVENAAARSQFTGRGHHPHPLKFGGKPNPKELLPTGETRTYKNPIHTEITKYWNRVLLRINSTAGS